MVKIVNKLSKIPKLYYLVFLFVIVLAVSVGIPTLARFKNRIIDPNTAIWDGSVASSYRSGTGTEKDPYVISNGSELAYFAKMLENNNYENTYFKLDNNIILNKGIFTYDSEFGIQYKIDDNNYYLNGYTNDYYTEINGEGNKVGSVNLFNSLKNFNGTLDGNSYTISGLYISDESANEIGVFTNLNGNVKNLYITNSIVNGGYITGLLAANANDSNLENVVVDGYVIGKNSENIKQITESLDDKTVSVNKETIDDKITLFSKNPELSGNVKSVILKGNIAMEGDDTSILINGVDLLSGDFEVSLGTNLTNEANITVSSSSEGEVKLTNLSYEINYYDNATSLIAKANNVNLKNVINKADMYGFDNVAGLIGIATNINIEQSYNNATINSTHAGSGLISRLCNSVGESKLEKVYNNGEINTYDRVGLIDTIENNETVTINNTFNAITTDYVLNKVESSNVSITNSYDVSNGKVNIGSVNGSFTNTTLINLRNKSYMVRNLDFNEFIDSDDLKTNPSNIWVYEDNSLPILAIDDINNPIANIYVGEYKWNDLGFELDTVKFANEAAFSIEAVDSLRPLKEVYYYISKSKDPLMKDDILAISDWVKYENIVSLKEEGYYTIYVKAIDYNNNEFYINTDLIIVDLSGADVTVNYQEKKWNNLNQKPGNLYVSNKIEFTVEATDELSGVKSIEYYLSDKILSEEELKSVSDWKTYTDKIEVDDKGKNIVYVKVIDGCDFISYVNTDYIMYDGYQVKGLYTGYNKENSSDNLNITSNSSLTFDISYQNEEEYQEGYKHNIITNILLPVNTKMILIDHKDNKVYSYKINTSEDIYNYENSCLNNDNNCSKTATYPFTLFTTIGKATMEEKFNEAKFEGKIDEDYSIILDFSDVLLSEDINDINLYVNMQDKNDNIVRSTLVESIKKFNLYSQNSYASLSISSDYNGEAIKLNSDSNTEINLSMDLVNKQINNEDIYDTTFENKTFGFMIRLVDKDGNMLDQDYLKNLKFIVDDKEYVSDNDGFVRIDLNTNEKHLSKQMIINTSIDNTKLKDGNYSIKVTAYAAYDGKYTQEFSVDEVEIPAFVKNGHQDDYLFNVLILEQNKIISKKLNQNNISLDIIEKANLENPNIRISFYKKKELTAYNQDYKEIPINDYIFNDLELAFENTYYLIKNPKVYDGTSETYNHVDLNLNLDKLDYGGYKMVFDLYDGDTRVGTIEKKFIVK